MKEYRKKRESSETAEEQLAKKQKQNAYMKEYRRRKKNNEPQSEKLVIHRNGLKKTCGISIILRNSKSIKATSVMKHSHCQ